MRAASARAQRSVVRFTKTLRELTVPACAHRAGVGATTHRHTACTGPPRFAALYRARAEAAKHTSLERTHTMKLSNSVLARCACLATIAVIGVACGAAEESSEGEANAEAPAEPLPESNQEGNVEVLNEFDVAGEHLQFLGSETAEGELIVTISSEMSPYLVEGVVDRLWAEHGAITELEAFYALAGRDAVPHERLVSLHTEQAIAMGREDESVHMVEFDANAPVQKYTNAQCDAWVYDNAQLPTPSGYGSSYWAWWDMFTTKNNLTGSARHDLCVGNDCNNRTNAPQVVGGCATDGIAINTRSVINTGSGWVVSANWASTTTARRYYKYLQLISGQYTPFKLSVQGQNNSNTTSAKFAERGARAKFQCNSQNCPVIPYDSQANPWVPPPGN